MPYEVKMPQLGMNQDSAVIVHWLKGIGDKVAAGDAILEVETDKATVEVEATADGFLSAIRAGKGEDVLVGGVIAAIVETKADVTEFVAAAPRSDVAPGPGAEAPTPTRKAATIRPFETVSGRLTGKILASPKAKRLAVERGIDLADLRAQGIAEPIHADDLISTKINHQSGHAPVHTIASPSVRRLAMERGVDIDALAARLGRETIAREDVLGLTFGATTGSAPDGYAHWDVDHAQYGPITEEPLDRMARVAIANLTAAHQLIPAVTHHDSVDVSLIEATRARLKAEGQKVTALAFHIAILIRCLREFPRFNASLAPDGKSLILKNYVNIGVAVDTPHGLVVPVIRNADRKSISDIADNLGDLAGRTRARRIRPEELGGASMTISSLGRIGGEAFTPIINPPEVAILGLSRTEIRPVWDGNIFQPTPKTPLDLTYDHRVINGADASRFLTRFCQLACDPDAQIW